MHVLMPLYHLRDIVEEVVSPVVALSFILDSKHISSEDLVGWFYNATSSWELNE